MSLYSYEGTGGYEGDPELVGQDKPQLYGNVQRIRPVCINREKSVYQVHYERIGKISAVYENGRRIQEAESYDGWYVSYESLFLPIFDAWADLYETMGDIPKAFVCDNNHGAFRLNFRPTGVIICDASGPNTYTRPPLDVG